MKDRNPLIPSVCLGGGRLKLVSANRDKGTATYRGQVFSYGEFDDPDSFFDDKTVTVDKQFAQDMIKNYREDTIGAPVQVPFGDHSRNLRDSAGVVSDLFIDDNNQVEAHRGLWGDFEIHDTVAQTEINAGRAAAISPGWVRDWVPTRRVEGKKQAGLGPTLIHAAIVDVGHFNLARLAPSMAQALDGAGSRNVLLESNMKNQKHLPSGNDGVRIQVNAGKGSETNNMEITKEMVEAATEEQLNALGLKRAQADDGQGNEGEGDNQSPPETKTDETGESTTDSTSNEGGDDGGETKTDESKTDESGSNEVSEGASREKILEARVMTESTARVTAEAAAECEDLLRKGVINRAQLDTIKAELQTDLKTASIDNIDTVVEAHKRRLKVAAAGDPKVEFGERGTIAVKTESMEATEAGKTMEKFGVTKEMLDDAKEYRKEHGSALGGHIATDPNQEEE